MSSAGNRIISSLCYRDAHAAISWLECAFGFTPHLVVPGEDGGVRHAQLKSMDGNCMIMLFSVRDDDFAGSQRPPELLGGSNQSICLIVEDVDTYHARAVEAGAQIILPLTEQDYGGSAFTCRDPEGHLWSFGSYDPWVD
ncbi:MAG: VOC family protein [Planctomycetota bacterium]|jgi:uncharacterized glyoxalase superfamily protein PhnB